MSVLKTLNGLEEIQLAALNWSKCASKGIPNESQRKTEPSAARRPLRLCRGLYDIWTL